MKLTEKDINKKITSCGYLEDVRLRGIYNDYLWLERDGKFFTEKDYGNWEVVEEKKEACNCFGTSYQNYKAHEPTEIKAPEGYLKSSGMGKPAEPKKSIAGEINDIIQKSSDPMMNITPEYQKMRSAYQANLRLNALISVLDEKFKELE